MFNLPLVYYFITGNPPVLMIAAILIYLLNALKIRFADDQSMHMLMLSIATVMMFDFNNYLEINMTQVVGLKNASFPMILGIIAILIPSYWLLVSPLPVLAGYDHRSKVMDILPIAKPLNVAGLRAKVEEFISPIKAGERVLFAFPDPENQHKKCLMAIVNSLNFHTTWQCKNITMFPDWWAVFELNYEGATELWGVEPNEVNKNKTQWNCDYVVVYENENYPYDAAKWSSDYEELTQMDWSQFKEMFAGYKKLRIEDLRWHLLKPKINKWELFKNKGLDPLQLFTLD